MNHGLGSVVVELFLQAFKLLSNESSGRKKAVVRKKERRKKFKLSTHYNCSSICDTFLEKNAKINAPLNPVPELFLKKRVLYVIR